MKYATTLLAIMASMASTVVSLPTSEVARQFKIPTCGATTCLAPTNGLFDGCAPNDLACLCALDQGEVSRYVSVVQPCIDSEVGLAECTAGAIDQYKSVLKSVCNTEQFGHKVVAFPASV